MPRLQTGRDLFAIAFNVAICLQVIINLAADVVNVLRSVLAEGCCSVY